MLLVFHFIVKFLANLQAVDWATIMKLAFQCIGIIYGDIGTSPIYTFPGIFPNGITHNDDILGVLSLIIYSLILVLFIKYVFIVLAANDNGDGKPSLSLSKTKLTEYPKLFLYAVDHLLFAGGTFALYSLICRYAKVGLIPNQQVEDKNVSNYQIEIPNRILHRASAVKSFLESSKSAKSFLLFTAMLGTSMVLGDGILTPCISVISAVGGIKATNSSLTNNTIMWISVVILILLFQVQRFGTDKVGFAFAPILIIWFLFIFVIGIGNSLTLLMRLESCDFIYGENKKDAWISLGGVVLCLTGSEALFADLGHFNLRSIQISTCKPIYWPMLVVAALAAIIASQSLISASFSIVQQSLALWVFPTSQVYIPEIVYILEINNILMIACVVVTLAFQTTVNIGNAYGIAVVFVFTITSAYLVLVVIMIWKTHIALIVLYVATICLVEYIYLSSVLYKFVQGGYLPLAFAALLMSIMFVWNYVHRRMYMLELENKVSVDKLKEIANNPDVQRVSGVGLFYPELVQGISPIFTHYIDNVRSLHKVLVFVTIKSLPISKVLAEESFFFWRIKPYELCIFRCVVRYGYKDVEEEGESFKDTLMKRLKDFIHEDWRVPGTAAENVEGEVLRLMDADEGALEVKLVDNEINKGGIVYMFGESEVVASKVSSLGKKMIINCASNGLERCLRRQDEVFDIPRKRLLKVGMTYEL
ncbi:hypothetical protein NE237_030095 [Protea cynaroides]|uniref:Potassium transporter n=1 Tax=Protea cynaroides TaxID=273540 RepID=A0A9Q0GT21_9MAGN|nr:hypothetical protein NE237_030095 [Protea cynaroides]